MKSSDIAVIGVALVGDKFNTASDFWAYLIDPEQADEISGKDISGTLEPSLTAIRATLPDHWQTALNKQSKTNICLFSNPGDLTESAITTLSESDPHLNWSGASKQADPALLHATSALLKGECDHALVVEICAGQSTAALLTLMDTVDPGQDHVYAIIKGLTRCSEAWTEPAALYRELEITPDVVSYLLVPELLDIPTETASHISELYQSDSPAYTLPIGMPGIADAQAAQILPALVQAALALSNKLIPGNPANASFSYQLSAPLYLTRKHRPWFHRQSQNRCAAIHDQVTGIHLLLEEIPESSPLARPIELPFPWEAELAVFSTSGRREMVSRLEQFSQQLDTLRPAGTAPIDIAVALKEAADFSLPYRLAIVFKNIRKLKLLVAQALEQLRQDRSHKANSPIYYGATNAAYAPKVACIFPGLGFPGLVGRYTDNLFQLSLRIPEIRRTFDLVERRDNFTQDPYPTSHLYFPTDGYDTQQSTILKNRLASPKHSEAENYGVPDRKNLSSFCVALSNWSSWMVVQALDIPIAMTFGQSLGELTALCAAGKFDFKQFSPIYWNTEVDPKYFTEGGGLVLVSASAERIEPIIQKYETVVIAVHISPNFQLLGGRRDEILDSGEELKKESIWTQPLPYPAIHTPYFSALRTSMEPVISKIPVYPSNLDVYSGMTCEPYPNDPETVRSIMLDNLDHPVHLWQVTRKMYEDGARVMLQAGGGATMYSQARTNIGADDVTAVSIDVDYRGPIEQINHMCAALFAAGVSPDLDWLYRYRSAEPERWTRSLLTNMENHRTGDLPEQKKESKSAESSEESELSTYNKLPFRGQIQSFTRDESLLVEYTLDLDNDLHLADHAFIAAQGVKPLSECLAVLPMTVSLEIMAQTAAHLARGYGLTGFKNISATHWIALRDTRRLKLKINADRTTRNTDEDTREITVSITSEGRTRPDISGVVVLSKAYHETLRFSLPQLENPRLYPLSAEEIYAGKTLFHGPLFQCISGETWLGDNGIIGELTVVAKQGMFADNTNPVLLGDPLLLDAVGQLIGLWAMEYGEFVYPISLEQIEIYAPTPPVGTRVPVSICIRKGGIKTVYADIEIQDGNGHLWMRIKQWGDWAFKWPKLCVDYTRRPAHVLYASSLDISVPGNITACIAENMRMDSSMLEMVARTALCGQEMDSYKAMAEYPQRQKQWLIGRVTAKDAVRSWLLDSGGPYLHPAAIVIEREESGQPVVCPLDGYPQAYISISHTEKYTVAIAGDHPVGIDIEAIATRDSSFVEAVSTQGERQLMEQINQDKSQGATLLWSAKESAGKLAGTGLPNNPKQILLQGMDNDGLLRLHHLPLDVQIRVNSWLSDNHFITVALND